MEKIKNRLLKMAKDVEEFEGFLKIDNGVDTLISALGEIEEGLKEVVPENDSERRVVKNVKDIIEKALMPYTMDLAKEMESIEE